MTFYTFWFMIIFQKRRLCPHWLDCSLWFMQQLHFSSTLRQSDALRCQRTKMQQHNFNFFYLELTTELLMLIFPEFSFQHKIHHKYSVCHLVIILCQLLPGTISKSSIFFQLSSLPTCRWIIHATDRIGEMQLEIGQINQIVTFLDWLKQYHKNVFSRAFKSGIRW